MQTFEVMDDELAITRCKGVFKQVKVYRRGDRLFIAHGSGFVGLKKANDKFYRFATTLPDVMVIECSVSSEKVGWGGISNYAELRIVPSSDGTVRRLVGGERR